MQKNRLSNTNEIVLIGLMIALTYLAGSIIKIPTFGGFVQIGDCMVFISVLILGKKKGALSSALGMFLVDALGGYYFWAPFTFIIKGSMAYIAGFILEKMAENHSPKKYTIAFLISGLFMVIAYFCAGIIISGFLTEKAGLIQGIIISAKDLVGNIIQVSTGIIIALPLSAVVIKAKQTAFIH